MFRIIRRFKAYWARETARHQKLEAMFQPGKEVRNIEDGEVYFVKKVDMSAALLVGKDGVRYFVDWLTPACTIRTEVADDWEPVDDTQLQLNFD
jgi:hypothetical protein